MLPDLTRVERPAIYRDFVQATLQPKQPIVATAKKYSILALSQGGFKLGGNLRLWPSIQMNPHPSAFSHKHDVMPRLQTNFGSPSQHFVSLIPIEKKYPARHDPALIRSSSYPKVFATRRAVAIRPA